MRVPTYKQQTAGTEKTGATMFSVQANPGAMSAGLRAVGEMFAQAEGAAIDYYANEQKIRRQSELNDAEFKLKQELQQLQTEQTTRTPDEVLFGIDKNGTKSFKKLGDAKVDDIFSKIQDKRVARAFRSSARDTLNGFTIDVNQSARNRLIDQNKASELEKANALMDEIVTGNISTSAIATEKLFGDQNKGIPGHYEQMAADGYIKASDAVKLARTAFVAVRERTQKANAAILESNVNKNVLIAGDVGVDITSRQSAMTNLNAEIDKAVEKNTITVDEGVKAKASAADDAVRGTLFGLMSGAPDATAIVMSASAGTLKDPILQDVFSKMDAGDKIKVINDMFSLGNKMDTERRESQEAGEVEAEAVNKKNFLSIINVDTDDPAAMTTAKELHKELLKDDYYTAAERNAAEARLGLSAKPAGTETKTTKNALKILNRADNDNTLTLALVDSLETELSPSDYNAFYKRAITEGKEGRPAAKNLISSKLRYNEFKDTTNALGDASDAMFQESMFQLDDWLNTPGEGAGATYQATVTKARKIIAANDVEYKSQMRDAIDSYLQASQTLMVGLPGDLEGAKQFLQQRLQANPGDVLAVGIAKTIKSYEKLLRN